MPTEPSWLHPEAIKEARAARERYLERSAEVADAFMAELLGLSHATSLVASRTTARAAVGAPAITRAGPCAARDSIRAAASGVLRDS